MLFITRSFLSLIQILHSENGENSISWGVTFGFLLGFNPLLSLQSFLLLFFALLFRVQIGAVLLSWALFSIISLLLHGPFESIGFTLLSSDYLLGIYKILFGIPGFHFTLLNNSLVMGNFAFSIFFSPFMFFISKALIRKYRGSFGAKIQNSNYLRYIKASKLYSVYQTYSKVTS